MRNAHVRTYARTRLATLGLRPRCARATWCYFAGRSILGTRLTSTMYKKVADCRKKLRKVLEVSGSFRNFAPKILTWVQERTMKTVNSNSQTVRQSHPVEVLTFRKGIRCATIVTDGERTKSFEWEHSQDHASLHQAIAYLESQGYEIDNEEWT